MKKLKLWHKILIISFIALIVILLSANIFLNYYLKNQIVSVLNESLNAEVKINKLRVNFLSSTIKIYEISVNETVTGKNELLIYTEKAGVKLSDFNRSEKTLIIEELLLKGFIFNNITDNNGNKLLESLIKDRPDSYEQLADQSIKLEDFTLFIESFEIIDSEFNNINYKTNEKQKINKINITVNSQSLRDTTLSTFSGNAKLVNDGYDFGNHILLSVEGRSNLNSKEKTFTSSALINLNNLSIDSRTEINFDKSGGDKSYIGLTITEELNKEITGITGVSIIADGVFDTIPSYDVSIEFFADDFVIQDKDNYDALKADFNIFYTYKNSSSFEYSVLSNGLFLSLYNDTLSGDILLSYTDSIYLASNNINGKINLKQLNNIFNTESIIHSGLLSANADLSGYVDKNTNSLNGTFKFLISDLKISLLNKVHNIETVCFYGDFNTLDLQINYKSSNRLFNSNVKLSSLQDFYISGDLHLHSDIYLNKITLPRFPDTGFKVSDGDMKGISFFPEKHFAHIKINIDTIVLEHNNIFDTGIDFCISPETINLKRLYARPADAEISGMLIMEKHRDYIKSKSNFNIKDFNFEDFTSEKSNLHGTLNITSSNTIYNYGDSIPSFNKSVGFTEMYMHNFKSQSDIGERFDLDNDIIEIDSLGIHIEVKGERIIIKPFSTEIGDVIVSSGAEINTFSDMVSSKSLIRIPQADLSGRSKLLIMAMAKSKTVKYPLDEDFLHLLIEISGSTSSPDYEIYELKN